MKAQVLILDFGGQYTQLIARLVRELGVYCEIVPASTPRAEILRREPKALILSGGPSSVNSADAPCVDEAVLHSGIPLFAICYGMQLVAKEFGGIVTGWGRDPLSRQGPGAAVTGQLEMREFGSADVSVENPIGIFSSWKKGDKLRVWMNHGDKVTSLPPGFTAIASSPGSPVAAFGDAGRNIYGVQFHPEVHHTPQGKEMFKNFLFSTAGLAADWDPKNFAENVIEEIRRKVPQGNVICALSGGVDSTVAAVLVQQAIGKRLHCIFVDNGLLRKDEAKEVMASFDGLGLQVQHVQASERFLGELRGVEDPEMKRKIIGRVFIDVFEEEAVRIPDVKYLVQGTLYPDVIESVSVVGKAVTIKSHHNVGGLKEDMKLELIEPLRELFKDEVRLVGKGLGIPARLLSRQPFPGPGLAVRCLGEVTKEKLDLVRSADKIVQEEIERAGLSEELWQVFALLLPVYSVGVMGDGRTYEQAIAIRAVTSRDGMTADWFYLPEAVLRRIATRIVNETAGINRVVLDLSTKPPATIEWE